MFLAGFGDSENWWRQFFKNKNYFIDHLEVTKYILKIFELYWFKSFLSQILYSELAMTWPISLFEPSWVRRKPLVVTSSWLVLNCSEVPQLLKNFTGCGENWIGVAVINNLEASRASSKLVPGCKCSQPRLRWCPKLVVAWLVQYWCNSFVV